MSEISAHFNGEIVEIMFGCLSAHLINLSVKL